MLSNPLSQIERTKDAYAGNMQGLEKRANMTKELVDLLAMQQLKKDLDAVKRNQAMQAQGNPATIKDQMQQGLMGEYRQQAAKEMGVGPSEADTVARAQQGMPQGMPQQQMAQRPQMPQAGAQQMAQGVMSQAQPVKLAGGGIVAFDKGSEDKGPVEVPKGLSTDELANFLRSTTQGRGLTAMEQAMEFKRLMGEEGFDPLGRPIIEEEPTSIGTVRKRARAAKKPEQGGLASIAPTTAPAQGMTTTRPAELTNEQYAEQQRENRAGIIGAANQRKKDEYESSLQGQLDELKTSGVMSGISPYTLDQKQRIQAEGELELDADKRGLAAVERIRGLSKMGDNEQLLKDMQARVQATYDETAPSRRDNLIDLLTAGGRGGITGVGVRDRQLRDAAAERRRQLDQDVMGIQATTIELNRNFGADAAKAYADAEANVITQKQNARNFLQNAEQAEVASVMDKARLTMEEQRNVRQLFSEQERNRLLAEQITANNARSVAGDVSTALAKILELRQDVYESVRLQSRYSELDTLDPSDSDDARKIELLEGELDTEVAARTADLDKFKDELTVRQLRAQEILMPSEDSEEVSLSPESQSAVSRTRN
jgi:hypothetical protein